MTGTIRCRKGKRAFANITANTTAPWSRNGARQSCHVYRLPFSKAKAIPKSEPSICYWDACTGERQSPPARGTGVAPQPFPARKRTYYGYPLKYPLSFPIPRKIAPTPSVAKPTARMTSPTSLVQRFGIGVMTAPKAITAIPTIAKFRPASFNVDARRVGVGTRGCLGVWLPFSAVRFGFLAGRSASCSSVINYVSAPVKFLFPASIF